ncbi:MAG: methyltransferase domain-containing protein [Candidatus Lokiarchaeota archaeon]|nr:methyltransferase domain-containing protein [Candidatus Lokiarchaeota archaeon]
MNKRQLISRIEQMRTFEPATAKVALEQYPTDAIAAVELVFIAGFMHDDLRGRLVIDLGTGTGRLAISAICMGAWRAIGVEIDPDALALASENATAFGLERRLDLVLGDVDQLALVPDRHGDGVTVIMNPPFGVQVKGADARFLLAAMALPGVDVIYSCHLTNEKNRTFLRKLADASGWRVVELRQTTMILPKLYEFHEKKRKEIEVDIYRIQPRTKCPRPS